MAETAIDRISRCLNLIPYIRNNPGISPDELAKLFNTTPKVITRDLETLFMCGLPGYTHLELIDLSIDEDSVVVLEPQNLGKPPRFTRNEAISILIGLLAISSTLSLATSSEELLTIKSAVDETIRIFKELLSTENSDLVGVTENKVNVGSNTPLAVPKLFDAISQRSVVQATYVNQLNQKSTRTLQPIRIFSNAQHLYLTAIDLADLVEKTFRVDRFNDVEIIAEPWKQHNLDSSEKELASSEQVSMKSDFLTNVAITLRGKALAFDSENPLLNCVEITPLNSVNGYWERKINIPRVRGEWLITEVLLSAGEIIIDESHPAHSTLQARIKELKNAYK